MTNANIYFASSFVVTALDGELWIALLLMGVGAVYLAHAATSLTNGSHENIKP